MWAFNAVNTLEYSRNTSKQITFLVFKSFIGELLSLY